MSMSLLIICIIFTKILIVNSTPKLGFNRMDDVNLEPGEINNKNSLTVKKFLVAVTGYKLNKKHSQDIADAEKIVLLRSNVLPQSGKKLSKNVSSSENKEFNKIDTMEKNDEDSSEFLEFPEDDPDVNQMSKKPVDIVEHTLILKRSSQVNNYSALTAKNVTRPLNFNQTFETTTLPHNNTNEKKTNLTSTTSGLRIKDIIRSMMGDTNSSAKNEPYTSNNAIKYTTKREALFLPKLLNILRNADNNATAGKLNKTCDGYEYDPTICQSIGNRLLCGYEKNIGEILAEVFEDLGNGCIIRGERMECGYHTAPFHDREQNPEYKNVAPSSKRRLDRDVENKQTSSNVGTQTHGSTKPAIGNGEIPPQMCVEKGERIVCYDLIDPNKKD